MIADEKENRVREIIGEQLGVSVDEVALDSSFSGELGADTLDRIELVLALEEEFDLEITEEDADHLKNVQDAVDLVARRTSA